MTALWALAKPFLPWILGAVAVVGGLFAFGYHERSVGAAKVQAQWDADRVVRIQRTTDQTNLWDQQRQKTEAAEHERDQARAEKFAAVQDLAKKLPPAVAATRVPGTFTGVLTAARNQANAAGATDGPDAAAAPAATSPDAAQDDTSLGLVAQWITTVAEIHAECRDKYAEWQRFYAGLVAAQLPEAK